MYTTKAGSTPYTFLSKRSNLQQRALLVAWIELCSRFILLLELQTKMSTSQPPHNNKCTGCQGLLPKREYLQCLACKAAYDLDCANISYKFFNLMTKKDQWKCPECVSKLPKTGNLNTPVRSSVTTNNMVQLDPLPPTEEGES